MQTDATLGIVIPSSQTPSNLIKLCDQLLTLKEDGRICEGWKYSTVVFVNGDRLAYNKVYERYRGLPEVDNWDLMPPKISFVRSEYNHHFSRAINVGFVLFWNVQYVLIINDDCLIKDENGINGLINTLEDNSELATVTPISIHSNGTPYWCGPISEAEGAHCIELWQDDKPRIIPWNNMAVCMFRMKAVRDVGLLRSDRVEFDRYHYYASDYAWMQEANKKGWKHAIIPDQWWHLHRELPYEE
jgi:hypothetical protein